MSEGLDYSFGRPNIQQMAAAGIKFVVRYLSATGKGITASELSALHAAGIDVALVYEAGAQAPLGGSLAGASTADTAVNLAQSLGAPAGTAIYFTVDFDAQPNQYYAIGQFFAGIKGHIGPYVPGVYGHADIVKTIQAQGIKYGWTTYAWSGGAVAPNSHLYQYENDVTLYGAGVDRDRSLQDDFGAWKAHATAGDPPPTKPTDPPKDWFDMAAKADLEAVVKKVMDEEREEYAKRTTAYVRAYGLAGLIASLQSLKNFVNDHTLAQGAKLDQAKAAIAEVEANVADVKKHLGVK